MENERETIKAEFCNNCESIVDTIRIECGGYEEIWGAKVWRKDWEEVCTTCHKDDIETIEVYKDDYTLVSPRPGD